MRNQISFIKRPATWIKHYDTSKEHILWSTEKLSLNAGHQSPRSFAHPSSWSASESYGSSRSIHKIEKDGKVLHFGVSNFTPSQFRVLQRYLDFPLVTNQIEISLSRIDPFLMVTLIRWWNSKHLPWHGRRWPEEKRYLWKNGKFLTKHQSTMLRIVNLLWPGWWSIPPIFFQSSELLNLKELLKLHDPMRSQLICRIGLKCLSGWWVKKCLNYWSIRSDILNFWMK